MRGVGVCHYPRPRAFGWPPLPEMHVCAWCQRRLYASACVWRRVRAQDARRCVVSATTTRIRVRLPAGSRPRCTCVRGVSGDYTHPRAFGDAFAHKMHVVAWCRPPRPASACVWELARAQDARECPSGSRPRCTFVRTDRWHYTQGRAFGDASIPDMHVRACSRWALHAGTCVCPPVRARDARVCVVSAATIRIRVRLSAGSRPRCTSLRGIGRHYPQPRAFGDAFTPRSSLSLISYAILLRISCLLALKVIRDSKHQFT